METFSADEINIFPDKTKFKHGWFVVVESRLFLPMATSWWQTVWARKRHIIMDQPGLVNGQSAFHCFSGPLLLPSGREEPGTSDHNKPA